MPVAHYMIRFGREGMLSTTVSSPTALLVSYDIQDDSKVSVTSARLSQKRRVSIPRNLIVDPQGPVPASRNDHLRETKDPRAPSVASFD